MTATAEPQREPVVRVPVTGFDDELVDGGAELREGMARRGRECELLESSPTSCTVRAARDPIDYRPVEVTFTAADVDAVGYSQHPVWIADPERFLQALATRIAAQRVLFDVVFAHYSEKARLAPQRETRPATRVETVELPELQFEPDGTIVDLDRQIAVRVARVRDDRYIELDIDRSNPELAAHVRFLALTPEGQAHEMNRCEESAGTVFYWRVDDGDLVRDVEPVHRRAYERRQAWRRALVSRRGRLARFRPLIRGRVQGRARRGRRRTTLRRSPAPDPPPPRPLELEAAA